jgi:Flp pilus assembly protein TadG
MNPFLCRLLHDQRGTVLIFVALAIFSLGAMAILSVDISRMMVARVQLQNAADAGALAGALVFGETTDPTRQDIRAQAKEISGMNKAFGKEGDEFIPHSRIQVKIDMDEQLVEVTTRSVVSQYFLGLAERITEDNANVRAVAAARLGEHCAAKCLKPWSIPDRWDDTNLVPGYPEWQNNGYYDKERFNDLNESGFWNPGEPYVDHNADGVYNQEFFHPVFTGYMAATDHGLQLELKASKDSRPAPGQYWPVDLPDEDGNSISGSDWYRWNISNCNANPVKPGDFLWTETGKMSGPTVQGMRNLYERDPGAYWDEGCECVEGSDPGFTISPRIGLIPLHDPRISIESGKKSLLITKIAAFFIEDIRGDGTVVGRFLRVQMPGEPCPEGETAGGFLWHISLVK